MHCFERFAAAVGICPDERHRSQHVAAKGDQGAENQQRPADAVAHRPGEGERVGHQHQAEDHRHAVAGLGDRDRFAIHDQRVAGDL